MYELTLLSYFYSSCILRCCPFNFLITRFYTFLLKSQIHLLQKYNTPAQSLSIQTSIL